MNWKRVLTMVGLCGGLLLASAPSQPPGVMAAPAAPLIFASPVHAGCYLERVDRCKIHVEPFTINLAPGKRLVRFGLVAIQSGTGQQTTIYDFRTDQSNPAPLSGATYTPSPVARDFAATCGRSYEVNLQGRDSGDAGDFSLGLTAQFTCPAGEYVQMLPAVRRP